MALPPGETVKGKGVDVEKVYSLLVPAARAIELTVKLAVPVFWIAVVSGGEALPTVTLPKARDAGLRLIAGAAAAATVKELSETVTQPCPGLLGSAFQVVPRGMSDNWLPYQATFHVYVPGEVGAGALSVLGHNGAFTGGFPVPVLLASSTPF